jgi:secondary thiamine-phosphate synthase enzyme
MLRQIHREVSVPTRSRGLRDITPEIARCLAESELRDGLATLLIRHTSASLLIQENADPDVREDLERFFARLIPDGDPLYDHTVEGPDDMPAHVRAALTAVTLSVPFCSRQLVLGTWQGIYLWEHRTAPHRRLIAVHLLGE